jgi:hypothetical protein
MREPQDSSKLQSRRVFGYQAQVWCDARHKTAINAEIVLRHAACGEPLLETPPDLFSG